MANLGLPGKSTLTVALLGIAVAVSLAAAPGGAASPPAPGTAPSSQPATPAAGVRGGAGRAGGFPGFGGGAGGGGGFPGFGGGAGGGGGGAAAETTYPTPAVVLHTDAPAGQRIFYCSHSLMWDTPAPLGEDAAAYGIKNHVLVGLERIGFSTTKQHWDQPDAQNQSKKALDTGKVDVFIMSPMELPDEGITNFVKYGLEKNPKMRFFAQNNWAAFNIDAQKWHSDGMAAGGGMDKWDKTTVEQIPKLNATSLKLYEEQVDKINKDTGHTVIWIIPTDQANEALRIKVAKNEFPGVEKQSQLFRDTIGHPGPVLQALNAYVHFATIYGLNPVGLPLPKVLKDEKAKNPKIDDDFNKRLQEIAWDAVTHYSYSGVKAPDAAKDASKP